MAEVEPTVGAFPSAPIKIIDSLADILEHVTPELQAVLGRIGVEGATEDSLEWTGELDDAARRVYDVLDAIFAQIGLTPTIDEPPAKGEGSAVIISNEQRNAVSKAEQPAQSPEQGAAAIVGDSALLLQFAVVKRVFKLRDLRVAAPQFADISSHDFKLMKARLVEELAAHGVVASWSTDDGKTRAKGYIINLDDVEKALALLEPAQSAQPEAELEEEPKAEDVIQQPVPEPVAELEPEKPPTAPEVPQPDPESLVDSTVEEAVLEATPVSNGHSPPRRWEPLATFVERGASPLSIEQIMTFFEEQGAAKIGFTIGRLLGSNDGLPRDQFTALRNQFTALVDEGRLVEFQEGWFATTKYIEQNGPTIPERASRNRRAHVPSRPSEPSTQRDIERMLRDSGAKGGSTMRPTQRHRGWKR